MHLKVPAHRSGQFCHPGPGLGEAGTAIGLTGSALYGPDVSDRRLAGTDGNRTRILRTQTLHWQQVVPCRKRPVLASSGKCVCVGEGGGGGQIHGILLLYIVAYEEDGRESCPNEKGRQS